MVLKGAPLCGIMKNNSLEGAQRNKMNRPRTPTGEHKPDQGHTTILKKQHHVYNLPSFFAQNKILPLITARTHNCEWCWFLKLHSNQIPQHIATGISLRRHWYNPWGCLITYRHQQLADLYFYSYSGIIQGVILVTEFLRYNLTAWT